jgi:gamma-glutamyltranspeptidase/glutathione hydrolase
MHLPQRITASLLLTAGVLVNLAYPGDPDWIARSKTGMVASDSPEASQVGAAVLESGGNAFDAAVATSFALAVARPQSTGLGGGGFMVAYVAKEDRFIALDFRETAPAGATPEHYANIFGTRGDGPSPSIYGGNAVGVPGQLAGLFEINRRFGERSLAELIQPAIELGERGFAIDEEFLHARQEVFEDAAKWPQLKTAHARLYELLSPGGATPRLGDKLRRPALVKGMRLAAERGPDAFYNGPIGDAIVCAVRETGGVLTMDDLRNYRVKERQPLRFQFYDAQTESTYEFVTMPPPSSGGVCMAEFFNIMQVLSERSDLQPGGIASIL